MRRTGFWARVALVSTVAAAIAVAVPSTSAGGQTAATRELRSEVPLGKSDAEFGRIVQTPGKLTPPSTPLKVRLRASETPRVGKAFTVTLEVHAYEAAPGTTATITLPSGAQVVSGSTSGTMQLAKGQTRSLSVTAELTQAGEQAIEGTAHRRIDAGESWGDIDQLFFTVGTTSSLVGYQSASNSELTAQQVPGTASSAPAEPRAVANFQVCWQFINRQGGKTALRDILVLLVDDDAGADDTLKQAVTNANGCATFSGVNTTDADEGGAIDAYVQFQTDRAGRYRVENYGGGIYFCNSGVRVNATGSFNFGTWFCGSTSGNGRALPLFDDAYLLRRFVMEQAVSKGFGNNPGSCTIRWQTGGTDGTYYTTSDNKVHLADANARSRDITVHECSHRQMHVQYGGFPVTDCPSPHFIAGVSGKICAWTEGWTYVHTAGVDGNPVYTFDSGATINFETAHCNTANFDDGSKVEGRVGGVLIDLMDPFTLSYGPVSGFANEGARCGGRDAISGQYGRIWDLFSDQNDLTLIAQEGVVDSFSRAWQARAGAGYPLNPAWEAGKVNSIPNFTRD